MKTETEKEKEISMETEKEKKLSLWTNNQKLYFDGKLITQDLKTLWTNISISFTWDHLKVKQYSVTIKFKI